MQQVNLLNVHLAQVFSQTIFTCKKVSQKGLTFSLIA